MFNGLILGPSSKLLPVVVLIASVVAAGPSVLAAEEAGTVELETVVVTASPIGDPDALATIAGSVDRNQILRNGGGNLADVLADVPGVSGSGFTAGASRPVIRGFDANRVRLLEDGVGSFDVSDIGPDHGVPLDPLTAERVEVVRGAATLRYGSQAIGGVVNVISKRVPTHLALEPISADITAGLGSNAESRDGAAQMDFTLENVALHADGFARRSDDYDTPVGRQLNTWARGAGAALGGTWFASERDRIGLGVVHYGSKYGIAGEDSQIDMRQTKLLLRSAVAPEKIGFDSLTIDGGWADYEHQERDADGATLATFQDREWDLRAEAMLGSLGGFREIAVGMQLQQRAFSALGDAASYLAPTHSRSAALFAFSEKALHEDLRWQLGGRVEHLQVAGTSAMDVATRRSYTPLSLSSGLVLDASERLRIGLALASAARAPAATELYARGPHEGPGTWEIGDSSLSQERSNSLELSVRWRTERLHADGSLWTARFRNFIYGDLTGRSCDDAGQCLPGFDADLREMIYTQRKARFVGAEGHADWDVVRLGAGRLELQLRADIVRAKLAAGGFVPRIPPWHLGVGMSWESARLDTSVALRYAARQNRPGEGDTPTAGYTNLDVQLGWHFGAMEKGVDLVLAGRNLTDSQQRNAVALNKDEILQPGRDLRLMLRAQF